MKLLLLSLASLATAKKVYKVEKPADPKQDVTEKDDHRVLVQALAPGEIEYCAFKTTDATGTQEVDQLCLRGTSEITGGFKWI